MRRLTENRCIGIHVDMVWEHWATRGPLYYVMAQMAWNPYRDGDAMLADYYRRGFAEAAVHVRDYWDLMERKSIQSQQQDYDYPELFDEAFFREADACLERAMSSLRDAPDVFRRRVAFVKVGLDYTRWVTEARKHMVRYEESEPRDQAAAEQARAIWVDAIKPLAEDETFPYALRWQMMRPGHFHNRHSYGRYPDDLSGAL